MTNAAEPTSEIDGQYDIVVTMSAPQATPPAEPRPTELLARLILGSLSEGLDVTLKQLREAAGLQPAASESATPESSAALLGHAAVGASIEALGALRSTAQFAMRSSLRVGKTGWGAAMATSRSPMLQPLAQPVKSVLDTGLSRLERWVELGKREETASRKVARDFAGRTVDLVVAYLEENDQAQELIRRQAGRLLDYLQQDTDQLDALVQVIAGGYIAYLETHPEAVEPLIRKRGDAYVDYLRKNPGQVQDLIQGQSVGLVAEVMDEVRERTVTADSFVETFVRTLLRRPQREELPEPPPEIKAQAVRTLSESRFPRIRSLTDE